MTGNGLNLRYERKFLAPEHTPSGVLAAVRRHPALFREAYPARRVNSLYLDTPARQDYFEHVNGAPSRVKTRIRWYGNPDGLIEKPALERKSKHGLVSGKLVFPLPPLSAGNGIAPPDLNAALDRAALPPELRLVLRYLQQAVVVSYLRHYLQSADGCFRLTLDSQLRFSGVNPGTGNLAPAQPRPFPVIIELKFDPRFAGHAALAANAWPYRLSRCSKYVLGIERLLAGRPVVSCAGVTGVRLFSEVDP